MKEDDNMFVDEVLINVQAGNGGNGCMAYLPSRFNEYTNTV